MEANRDLPEELVVSIFSYSGFYTLKNARLACKAFARIGVPFVFSTVHTALLRKSLDKLVKIASSEHLRTHVTKLVFHGQVPWNFICQEHWEALVDMRPTRDEYVIARGGMGSIENGCSTDEARLTQAERRKRIISAEVDWTATPKHTLKQTELDDAYRGYRQFGWDVLSSAPYYSSAVQGSGPEDKNTENDNGFLSSASMFRCDSNLLVWRFSNAIRRLSNLRDVLVTAFDREDDGHPFWLAYKSDIGHAPRDWKKYTLWSRSDFEQMDHQLEGVPQLSLLLSAMSRTVTSLEFSTQRDAFWVQRHRWGGGGFKTIDMDELDIRLLIMEDAFMNLRHLNCDVEYELETYHTKIAETLARFLHRANNLEHLRLRFMEDNWLGIHEEEPQCDLLELLQDVQMPKLKRLYLSLTTTQDSLLGFLHAVSPSLRDLELYFVLLREDRGSWNNIIYKIPEFLALDKIELDMVHDLDITSPSEDDNPLGRRLFEIGLHYRRSCYATQVLDYILRRTAQRPIIDIDWFNEAHTQCQKCDID